MSARRRWSSIENVAPKVERTMDIDDVVGNPSVCMPVPVPEPGPDGGSSGSSSSDSAMGWSMIIATVMMILVSALVMKNRRVGSEGWSQEGMFHRIIRCYAPLAIKLHQ